MPRAPPVMTARRLRDIFPSSSRKGYRVLRFAARKLGASC